MHVNSKTDPTSPSLLVRGSQTARPIWKWFFRAGFPPRFTPSATPPTRNRQRTEAHQIPSCPKANRIATPTATTTHQPPTQSAEPPRRPANLVRPCICSPRRHPRHAYNIHTCDFRLGRAGFINRNRWNEDICAGRSRLLCQKTFSGAEIAV